MAPNFSFKRFNRTKISPQLLLLGLSVFTPVSFAQSNMSTISSIESLQKQNGSMITAMLMVMFAILVIKIAYTVFRKMLSDDHVEVVVTKPHQPTALPVPVSKPIEEKEAAIIPIAPQEYWIKDAELKSLWLMFEDKLNLLQTHKHYTKEYVNHRNIQALKANVMAVLEPYVANTVDQERKDFYTDIRSGIVKTLHNANSYLDECYEDLLNITKKSMKVDLIYLEQKLK